jgi:DSF synthase
LYQNPRPRPCFNWDIVDELRAIQSILEMNNGYLPSKGRMVKIEYLVLDSALPGIFSMGGDLNLFKQYIEKKDKESLLKYVKVCIDTIHGFIVGCRLPITTIALVRGDAMGGGFEVALSCQVMIAEKNIQMGFPEVLFNLFPGMGGYHLLSQRIPVKQVEKMMLSGIKYPVEQLYEMGVVDRLVEVGEGREAVYEYVREASKYRNAYTAIKNVREKVHSISHEELMDVCKYWVEIAMNISERDLKLMERLVRAQTKKLEVGSIDNLKEKTA